MPNLRPVVAHVMRGFLDGTETFIGNQIMTLNAFKPIVLCHHQLEGHGFPLDDIASATETLTGAWRMIGRGAYKLFRVTTRSAVDALARYAFEREARLLHFHYVVDARFFVALKRKTGLPTLVSAYGYDVSSFPKLYGGFGKHYLRAAFDQFDWFIAMSHDMRRDMISLGCPPDKIIVHYHGIDTQRFAYPERVYDGKDEITVLACGMLEIKKAQHLTLQALRLMEQRGMTKRRFRVEIVGDGPMRAALEHQVREYGWEDKVNFHGHIPHHEKSLVEAYRRADIFSLPSVTVKHDKEGIPGTIVEAMASGLPVVSSVHAGIPEIISCARDGLLVEEGDVEAMARAFADLMNDVSLRQRLGQAAARRAMTELDLKQCTARLEDLYRRILGM